jgi:hypothetical protein
MLTASRATRSLVLLGFALWLFGAGTARAQEPLPDDPHPIGHFAADVRAAFPKFKADALTAAGIGVQPGNLPTRGYGFVVGAHWYPVRLGIVTFGVGGEMIRARRGRTVKSGTAAAPVEVTVNSRFSSLAPQISFNFGRREGWSYISGGIGSSKFTSEKKELPLADPETGSKTINYGGGARWFAKKHLAVSMDLRFYAVNPEEATALRPARSRKTMVTLSGGLAFK